MRIELAHSHCIVAARGSKHDEARGLCDSQFAVIAVVCSGRKGVDFVRRASSWGGFRPSMGGIRCPLGSILVADRVRGRFASVSATLSVVIVAA